MSTLPPPTSSYTLVPDAPRAVVITDINMSIGAMCRFMVKWVIAAIPAAIILWIIMLLVGALIALVFGGLIHGLMGPWTSRF
jgi:ABC-type multidrug transport system permease subunit